MFVITKEREGAARLSATEGSAFLTHHESGSPRGLNFTPTSANAALVGGPVSPAQGNKKINDYRHD